MKNIEQKEVSPFNINFDEEDDFKVHDLDKDPIEPKDPVEIPPVNDNTGDSDIEDVDEKTDIYDPNKDKEEEEVEKQEDPEYDIKVKGNIAKYFAGVLKSQGVLPEDFEVTDEVTEEQLDNAYVSYKEETLKNQIREEEKQRLADEEGLTPEMIEEVKLRYYGVQDAELQKLNSLQYLTSYKFDQESETFEKDARIFLQSYYTLKDINSSRIDKLVDTDLDDDDIINTIAEYQNDLKGDSQALQKVLQDRVENNRLNKLKEKEEYQQTIDKLLDSRVIDGVKYPADKIEIARRALKDRTEIVIGDDGQRYKATLYYKKRLEAARNPEKDLAYKLLFILGSDNLDMQNRDVDKASTKILGKLNDFVDVSVRGKNTQSSNSNSRKTNDTIERKAIN